MTGISKDVCHDCGATFEVGTGMMLNNKTYCWECRGICRLCPDPIDLNLDRWERLAGHLIHRRCGVAALEAAKREHWIDEEVGK